MFIKEDLTLISLGLFIYLLIISINLKIGFKKSSFSLETNNFITKNNVSKLLYIL